MPPRARFAVWRTLFLLFCVVAPADSGAILLLDDSNQPVPATSLSRHPAVNNAVVVSRSVIEKVLETRAAFLSNPINPGNAPDAQESLRRRQVQSVLAVPLLLFDKLKGVIYLETREPEVQFDEGHLQLMVGVAGMASIAIENARQMEWLETE